MAGGAFTALVLAGSRGEDDPVAQAAGVEDKCLAPLLGKPMLAWVLEALRGSASVGRIAVVASHREDLASLCREQAAEFVPAAASPAQSVLGAVKNLAPKFPLLVVTADNPLLTPERIDAFCRDALASKADLAAGLVPSAAILAAFPQSKRTYLRFRDERYSGANIFALMTEEALSAVAFWRRVERERKKPWRIVRAFGLGSLLAYALNRLTLDEAFARTSQKLGVRAAAVRLGDAEAAVDVDRAADLELAEALLRARV